jgi:hypothetical protein
MWQGEMFNNEHNWYISKAFFHAPLFSNDDQILYDIDQKSPIFQHNGKVQVILTPNAIVDGMGAKYQRLRDEFNSSKTSRISHLPEDPLRENEELTEDMRALLDKQGIKDYHSLVGSLFYMISRVQPSDQLAHEVLLTNFVSPRRWDLHMAVWCLE